MKRLLLAFLTVLSGSSVFAFPLSDITFNCPNGITKTTLSIPLIFDATANIWTGKLVENINGKDMSVGPITAIFVEDKNRMELSLSTGVIGLMNQTGEHSSMYKDGHFVLSCTF